jgi:NTP pyrophosphatase (non-canonical NTP hydrolase)
MDFEEYKKECQRTSGIFDNYAESLCCYSMGLAGEAGEVVDYVKKLVFHGHKFSKEKLIEELGDVLWYFAMFTSICDLQIDEIMRKNIEKLYKRYPNGFSKSDSIERVDEKEKNNGNKN